MIPTPAHYAEMLALLKEYAHRGRDIAEPSQASLIGRTRKLLAELEQGDA